MGSSSSHWATMKAKADQAEAAYQRSQGALQTLMSDLQEHWGVNSVEEAEEKLEELKEEVAELEVQADKALEKFKQAWAKWQNRS